MTIPRPAIAAIRRRGAWGLVLVGLLAALAAACTAESRPGAVHVLTADIAVGNVLERYIDRGIARAERDEAAAGVIRVDTPGGEIGAMRDIVGRIASAEVPVITFVWPPGAQAASAGTFIVMAGHIAAMAPSTSIGAATPVTATGEEIEGPLGKKVEEDTVSFARGVAELRDRNRDWAESAVREAASASPSEAVELNVVDLQAPALTALLREVDGLTVELLSGDQVTLAVADAELVFNGRNIYERVLEIVSDPIVVSVLILIGLGGLAIEFLNPGMFFPGILGVTATIASFLGVGTLLPAEAAIVFIAFGILLIVLEAIFTSSGILGTGGAVSVVLGLSILVGQGSTDLDLRRALTILVLAGLAIVGLLVAAFFLLARNHMAGTEQSARGWRSLQGRR